MASRPSAAGLERLLDVKRRQEHEGLPGRGARSKKKGQRLSRHTAGHVRRHAPSASLRRFFGWPEGLMAFLDMGALADGGRA